MLKVSEAEGGECNDFCTEQEEKEEGFSFTGPSGASGALLICSKDRAGLRRGSNNPGPPF